MFLPVQMALQGKKKSGVQIGTQMKGQKTDENNQGRLSYKAQQMPLEV